MRAPTRVWRVCVAAYLALLVVGVTRVGWRWSCLDAGEQATLLAKQAAISERCETAEVALKAERSRKNEVRACWYRCARPVTWSSCGRVRRRTAQALQREADLRRALEACKLKLQTAESSVASLEADVGTAQDTAQKYKDMVDALRGQYDQQSERLVAAESERKQCVEEFDSLQAAYRTAMARVQALEVRAGRALAACTVPPCSALLTPSHGSGAARRRQRSRR